ncbi:hypothetical protein ISTM_380 [Insectomime virus]|uniref:Uncharacterized protein n=1 Tax=Tunisvirus fontaine2 TaxID=1421067 RepID=V9SHA2_9VIRU|nr:hypothetical protein D1R32_gp420 [Tunisvirus fontaine2]AHA46278.1 hypothetical protein ISTM_380 [Insectomime virus]AHC55137.1 hypothetical protein TNS_ORF419 [Tunisvirus fontaine2]
MKSAITVVYGEFSKETDIHADACKVVGFGHRYECKAVPRVLKDGTRVEDLIPTHPIYHHQVEILKTYGDGHYTISCKTVQNHRVCETIRTYKNNKMPVKFISKKTRSGEKTITETVTFTSHNSFTYVAERSDMTEEEVVSDGLTQKVVREYVDGRPPRTFERKDGKYQETSKNPGYKRPVRVFLLNTGGTQ